MAKKQEITRIQDLDRRDWQLWTITLILLVCLTAFIVLVFFYGGSFEVSERMLTKYNMNVFLIGFVIFIILFCSYLIIKEREIKKLKHFLVENEIRIQTLKEFDEMKTDLINVVSHELRSPLTSVKNAVDIIQGEKAGDINENQKRFLEIAARNIQRLMNLIGELLDFSKMTAGKMKYMFTCLNLNEPIDAAITSLKARAENKSITISKELSCESPLVHGDTNKLEQVFINLIDNSIKFTNDGGHVSVSVKESLNAESEGDRFIEISIEDNGIGIKPEDLERVFDKFYQAEKSLSTTCRQGTGLGLAITKGLIEAHKGRIWVESEPERGTKFSFMLPQYNSQRILANLVENAINHSKEDRSIFSLMLVKLENFEYLKKTFGDKETFKLMDQVCRIVYDSIRKDRDVLEYQRLDGRVIVVLNGTPKEGCLVVEKRILDEFSKHGFVSGNKAFKTGLALGKASYPDEGISGDILIQKINEEI
ncbi:MAG: ATP-binding protein [bacterium]